MRYAIVCIGNLDIDVGSWLAGVSSDKSHACQLTDKANLSWSHQRNFDVFAIPDEDFIDERLTAHVELGEDAATRRAAAKLADRIAWREAAQKKAEAATRRKAKKAAAESREPAQGDALGPATK